MECFDQRSHQEPLRFNLNGRICLSCKWTALDFVFGLSFVFSSDRLPFWLLASVSVCLVFVRVCACFDYTLSLYCIRQRQIALLTFDFLSVFFVFALVLYSPTTNCPFDFWHGFFSPRSGNTVGGRLPTETFHLSLSLFLSKFLFSWLSLCIWTCIFVLTIADSALLTWLFQSRIHSRGAVSRRKYSTFHCSQPPFLL